ncbi:hypothetical protein ACHAXS_001910 [Conticribra weissflogii]
MSLSTKCYNEDPSNLLSSTLSVPGLFTDFQTAVSLLRDARPELRVDLIEDCNRNAVVEKFYNLLDRVESYLSKMIGADQPKKTNKFIVEVEGLDGSGKTTLVRKLQQDFPNSLATKTPSPSLKDIRPLWDHRGGIMARAFYMISNYVLEYEIANCEETIIIVDRWYASTCAYTVAYPDNNSSSKEIVPISEMSQDIFKWPKDMYLRPNILLVLQIDHAVRQKRVNDRAGTGRGASRFNPWDDRLAKDTALGCRILRALNRIEGPREVLSINANLSIDEVMDQARKIVRPAFEKFHLPATIVLVGTHASGKSTIGTALAERLGCRFDCELGDVERDASSLVAGGHLHGNGNSKNDNKTNSGQDWDDFLHEKECRRDAKCDVTRVVETWHIGNAAWYQLRQRQKGRENIDLGRYENAISKHLDTSRVIVVQLALNSHSAMVRRRKNEGKTKKRVPMEDDVKECRELHEALQLDMDVLLKNILDSLGLPFLRIHNDIDGDEAMQRVLCEAMTFAEKYISS